MLKTVLSSLVLLSSATLIADGVESKSAEEIAKELANPNTPLTSLKFKLQYTTYEGELPHADAQNLSSISLQPTLPFPLANGNTVWVRPYVPLLLDKPSFNESTQDFDSTFGLGDIGFDFQYGAPVKSGFLWSAGGSITLPTATDNHLGSDKYSAGPGFQIGYIGKHSILGTFINHQWSFAGSGDNDISMSTAQIFAVYLPGGGYSIASAPIIIYDHETDEATVPINVAFGKTIVFDDQPWKLSIEANYYAKKPDKYGPDWMIGINIAPVMKNALATWFK